jgi:DNA replicative helicase MCM subunit Mcm2 (Cdc46/Mcm family)
MCKKKESEKLDLKNNFLKFTKNFTLSNGFKPYCLEQILDKIIKKNIFLNINLTHVAQFDPPLYLKIIEYPSELIGFFDFILNTFFNETNSLRKIQKQTKIKIVFWERKINNNFNIQEITPQLFNKLVSFYGQIIKSTKSFSELSSILFKCDVCEFEIYSLGEMSSIQEPIYCFLCRNFNSFRILYNRCYFNKIKFFKIQNQQFYYGLKNNHNSILVISRNFYLSTFMIGENVKLTGILRLNPYFDKIKRLNSIFFGTYLDLLCIFKSNHQFEEKAKNNENFFKNIRWNFSFEIHQNKIKIKSLSENLRFYHFLQDSCFTGQIGIETIKKTLVSLYSSYPFKKENSCFSKIDYLNVLIDYKNTPNDFFFFKDILKPLKKYVYINGNIDNEKQLISFFEYREELNDTKLIKGKLLKGNNKICYIENLNSTSNDFVVILKEILTSQKISIVKSNVNCSLQVRSSIIATTKDLEKIYESYISKKTFNKNFYSLLDFFEIRYILKKQESNFFENYLLKYFTFAFFDKFNENKANHFNLRRVGIKLEGAYFFLEFKKKHRRISTPFFSLFEVLKLGNLIRILLRLKLKKKWKYFQNFLTTIKSVAYGFAKFRLSNIIGVEDIRLAFLTIAESLKTNFFYWI